MSGKYRLDLIDDNVADALVAKGYKLDGRSILVDIEEIADILDIIDGDDELEFDDHED